MRQRVHAHLFRGVDAFGKLLLPPPAGCQLRYGGCGLGSRFPGGPGGLLRHRRIRVAALAGENGDQLPCLGELGVQCRKGLVGRLAALLGALLFLGETQDGVPGRYRCRMLRAAADRTGRPLFQPRSQFGGGIGQAFLTDVQPLAAQFLVLFPAAEVPFGHHGTLGHRGSVARDDVHQLIRSCGFLGAQHGFACELLQWLQGSTQGIHLGAEGKQPDCVVITGAAEFLPPLSKTGQPCLEAVQPILVGKPFADHSSQRPQARKLRCHAGGAELCGGSVFCGAAFREGTVSHAECRAAQFGAGLRCLL